MDIKEAKNKIQDKAAELKGKAEARSEDIEGTVLENMGEIDNDAEKVQEGREKQGKAEALREEASNK
ncbi:MAG: hypothetical protein Tsb0014_09230 [Pleurocapsa sp.]